MSIPYTSKVDKRVLGQELHIFNEPHTIGIIGVSTVSPNMVKLVEVPRQDVPVSSIIVPGYIETLNPSPGSGQFYVDYVNGYFTFNSNANGNIVAVTYWGRGSEVDAVDVNELQGPVGIALDMDGTVTPNALIYGVTTATNPSGALPTSDVDNHTGIIVTCTVASVITLPTPTNTTQGRFFTVLNSSTSTQDLAVNGVPLTIKSGATFIWDASAWTLVSGGTATSLAYIALTNPSGTLPVSDVDDYTGAIVTLTSAHSITLPSPTVTTAGRFYTVLNISTSTSNLETNNVPLKPGFGATWIWDGSAWALVTGAAESDLVYIFLTNPSGTLPVADIDNYTGAIVTSSISSVITFPSPTIVTAGRFYTVLNSTASTTNITVNGVSLPISSGATWIWDGSTWSLVSGASGAAPILASDPPTPFMGQFYFNSTINQFVGWNGTSWVIIG